MTGTIVISTRRFAWRPASVELSATGMVSPSPIVMSRCESTPCDCRYDATDEDRLTDNDWLYASEPVLSVCLLGTVVQRN